MVFQPVKMMTNALEARSQDIMHLGVCGVKLGYMANSSIWYRKCSLSGHLPECIEMYRTCTKSTRRHVEATVMGPEKAQHPDSFLVVE